MNYSFEYIDIILLAMIAGFIFLRLRGILGKRTGFEGKAPPQVQEILKNVQLDKIENLIKLIKKYKLEPEKVVYFDDLGKNLKSAHKKGIITIHISEKSDEINKSFIDFRFKTVINALDMISKVL